METRYKDTSYIVTGGSGHLGVVLVSTLLELGAYVVNLSSRNIVDSNINSNPRYFFYEVDLLDRDELQKITSKLTGLNLPHLRGLVNFAARSKRGVDLDASAKDIVDTYSDVISPTWNAISVFRKLLNENSSIVNLGSLWGSLSPDPRVYLDLGNEPSIGLPPAKSAISELTRYLAVLLAKDGIRVNSVEPGWFPANRGTPREDYIAEISGRIPMARIGSKEELVSTFLFLLDPSSSYITGQNIRVDGGYSIW
jgi:NAD(P)-dependent dehydrogenase (short-subunit alcohol dehydrogenase family)